MIHFRFVPRFVIAGLLAGAGAVPAFGDSITVQSDASTLGASLAAPFLEARLDTPDTTGLVFSAVDVGAFGTFTPLPPGAPAAAKVINLDPGDGESGYFQVTFLLPTTFTNISLTGAANVDDTGRVFLNGNPLSPSIFSSGPNRITEFGDAVFTTSNASFFQPGVNVLLLSDDNNGAGPSGAAFYATITYSTSAVPEPGSMALLVGMSMTGAGFLVRRKHRRH